MRQSTVALEEFALFFYVKVDPNPEADRVSHLEILDSFYEPLVSGSHGPGVFASGHGGFWKNFSVFLCEGKLGS